MKRKFTLGITVIFGIIAVSFAVILTNSFRWPETYIHDWLLKKASPGSSIEEVKSMISKNGWKLDYDWTGTPSEFSEKIIRV
jgi:hypothetical protein